MLLSYANLSRQEDINSWEMKSQNKNFLFKHFGKRVPDN